MIRAILYDLDGTLSLMNKDEFMRNYIGLLAPRFSHLLSPERFAKQVLRSTDLMITDPKPDKTNLQNFFDDFAKATGLSFNNLWPIFEEFYKNDFPALRFLVRPNPDGKTVVESSLQQGYIVAVAANPVMPAIAIEERISWAELTPNQFTVIPSIENFHYCKPHLGFFREIADNLGLNPEECLMVGNHPIEDIAARQIGMKTFLVGESTEGTETDYFGELGELLELIKKGNI